MKGPIFYQLMLESNCFSGTIESKGLLRELQYLAMQNNQLEGLFPDTIGNLSSLMVLSASNNTLSGVLPASMSALTQLAVLDISNNCHTGTIQALPGSLDALACTGTLSMGRLTHS